MNTKLKKKEPNIIFLDNSCKTMPAKELSDWLTTICTPEQQEIITCQIPLLDSNMLIGYGDDAVFILIGGDNKVIKISQKQNI